MIKAKSQPRILLLEDDLALAEVMSELFAEVGAITEAVPSIGGAIRAMRSFLPDLIVADLRLADGNGIDFVEYVRQREEGRAIPIIAVSAVVDKSTIATARRKGVDEYLIKPFQPAELLAVIRNHLQRQKAIAKLASREAHIQTVKMLANVIEARSKYTRGHSERVRRYALMLGEVLGWSDDEMVFLEFGALLHDIGKIQIPTEIIEKAGPLTPEEQALIETHPQVGAEMLRDVEHLKPVIPYVLYHHERCDGSGYPFHLPCEEIPPEGRLIAIADSYDAMVSNRPYREAKLKEVALAELMRGAGVLYDEEMVRAFVNLMQEDAPELHGGKGDDLR